MKRILIAPDKFKGTLSAAQVAASVRSALLLSGVDEQDITLIPMADGGEGSLEALLGNDGHYDKIPTVDSLMRPVECHYGLLPDGTAVVEATRCIGLQLLNYSERNPLKTTSFGLGLVLAGLIAAGRRHFIVAIGGSATDDGGAGMAAALGAQFYDAEGNAVAVPDGESLNRIVKADFTALEALTADCTFTALCDVRNPLLGPDGASRVYAGQKGADNYTVRKLEKGKCRFSMVVAEATGCNMASVPFAGAAGGLGWAMMVLLGAEARSGAEYIGLAAGLEEAVESADLIVTGEGRVDTQTAAGKVAGHIADLARRHSKRLVVFCGDNTSYMTDCYSLSRRFGRREAMHRPAEALERLAAEVLPNYI